ncbi:MAG: AAA-like domain-containing protein, partial [Myxococcales bacterium]|nr:AAA-like domain-containing protein [Myxococcales bacterium]
MSTRTHLFQIGGAIPVGRLYIERRADAEVVETLADGEFCYVLAPRQIGKSSLRLRAAKKLEQQGIRCVSIDFSGIGSSSVTIDEWYFSIAYEIAEELELPNPELFWTQHEHLTPVHRWYRFIRNELLDSSDEPVVVFIDEVDSVLALSFTTDDFFASIRSAYNLRAEDPAYRRLSFCLLGVAAPTDLIQNPVRTPFNIGHGIRLADFTRQEIDAFAPGLTHLGCDSDALLSAVFQWTSGHPYMTQRILEEIARQGSLHGKLEGEAVDETAYHLFLRSGKSGDATLAYVEKRLDMCDSRVRMRQMLHIYRKLLAGEDVLAEPNSPIQAELRLMGIAADADEGEHTYLRPRNLIFAEVYDLGWLKSKEKEHRLAESVERWLAAGKIDDWLLRGAALEDSLRWARGRADLTNAEHEFLLACVSLARTEAEDRHRTAEAMRLEESSRASLSEEKRRGEEQRLMASIERERAQRAEESAASQRRTISILTVMVAALG